MLYRSLATLIFVLVKVNLLQLPTATLSGGGSFFEGGSVELTVDLTGSPPWTFVYTFG